MIQLKSYKLDNKLTLTNELLVTYINKLWVDIFTDIGNTSHLMLMCKVQFTDDEMGYRTLGNLRKVNFDDKELFINYLTERLGLLNDSYLTHSISKVTFSYIIKEGLASDNRSLLQDLSNTTNSTHRFNNMKLPISLDPRDYGTVLVLNNYIFENDLWIYRSIVRSGTRIFTIDISKDLMTNKVRIEGAVDLQWTDTRLSNDLDESYTFLREINKSTIYFMDGEVVLRKQQLPAKAFRKLSVDKNLVNDFYTMDIETINQNGKLIPYLICGFDGKDFISSFGKDQNTLFKSFFDQLLSKVQPGTSSTVYAHNLSGFDGIFMLRHLIAYGKMDPLIHNGKLMSIKIKVLGKNKSSDKTITFKDSFLLLPHSLRILCKAFGITMAKGYFPFLLSDINYTGVFPQFEHWTDISLNEYESLALENKGKFWSFKLESIKYCKLDCQCLHELLTKFNELIFSNFKINIHKTLTLPSLAMRIFKSNFMKKDTIYQILGKPFYNISQSYTGGAVDVYIPLPCSLWLLRSPGLTELVDSSIK
jgi:hypothetical protein